MLPNLALSFTPIVGNYLVPDNYLILPLVDYELGGIGLQDPSQGSRYQVWKLEYVSGHVFISAPNLKRVILFSRPYITDISLAFDQNMNPFVSFTEADQAKYWWFDTTIHAMTFTELPAGSKYPKCCTDDKRTTQNLSSDIILAYIRDRKLYFRAQRDRFGVEYLLATDLDARLNRVGMTDQNRLQFKMIPL